MLIEIYLSTVESEEKTSNYFLVNARLKEELVLAYHFVANHITEFLGENANQQVQHYNCDN